MLLQVFTDIVHGQHRRRHRHHGYFMQCQWDSSRRGHLLGLRFHRLDPLLPIRALSQFLDILACCFDTSVGFLNFATYSLPKLQASCYALVFRP